MVRMIFEQNLEKLFLIVLNMSLTSCVVILAVLLARFLLKRAPKIFSYALWAAVLFRLLCPVSFSLPLSLLGTLQNEPARAGRMEYIAEDIGYMAKPEITLPAPGLSGAVNEMLPPATPVAAVNPMQVYLMIGAYLWLLGILGMGIYGIISAGRLRNILKGAVLEQGNIYRIAEGASPFVYGLFSPRIYLPEKMGAEERRYILLHEQIHIRRGDFVFRLLAFLALWLHWFNPLVWLAFVLSGRDMEMSCDEAVILRLGGKVKKEYSVSLLNMAAGSRTIKGIPRGVPLAFGESDAGSRIKNVLRYRKPTVLLAGAAAVFSAALAVFFLANPAKGKAEADRPHTAIIEELESQTVPPVKTEDPVREMTVTPVYTDVLSQDTGSELFGLLPERLRNGELLDGMYAVNVRSISRNDRGFDSYVTWEEETDLPLFAFAENCIFNVNYQMDKLLYEEVDFDTFADMVTDAVEVTNPTIYCEVADNKIVQAYLGSAYYGNGISYARPVKDTWVEDYEGILGMAKDEILSEYYVLSGTEMDDIADSAGEEKIEVYTGNIGDGESGVVIFKDAGGNVLGTESAHTARAGWNNIYVGKADGVGFILTVNIDDRDTYGGYGYQVFRFGEAGEIMQIAGSSFEFGGNRRYDDTLFRTWADNISYYLEQSHLILSSQEGKIRTEQVSEADKYNYGTLRRKP